MTISQFELRDSFTMASELDVHRNAMRWCAKRMIDTRQILAQEMSEAGGGVAVLAFAGSTLARIYDDLYARRVADLDQDGELIHRPTR